MIEYHSDHNIIIINLYPFSLHSHVMMLIIFVILTYLGLNEWIQ